MLVVGSSTILLKMPQSILDIEKLFECIHPVSDDHNRAPGRHQSRSQVTTAKETEVNMWILNFEVNLVWAVLIFFSVFMVVYNSVIAFGEPYLPEFVLELFRYGKTLNGPAKTTFVKMISVPKSYFTHFYIFSSIYVPTSLVTVLYCYFSGQVIFHLNPKF